MPQYLSFVKHANTPFKRIGLLLLAASTIYWFLMAIHWNIYRHGYIYHSWDAKSERIPQPPETSTTIWISGFIETVKPEGLWPAQYQSGWLSYDKKCLKSKYKPLSILEGYPIECRREFTPDTSNTFTRTTKQSFTDFIDNLFSTHSDGHFKLSMFFLFLTVLGFMMFIGPVDKLLRWINTGKIDNK